MVPGRKAAAAAHSSQQAANGTRKGGSSSPQAANGTRKGSSAAAHKLLIVPGREAAQQPRSGPGHAHLCVHVSRSQPRHGAARYSHESSSPAKHAQALPRPHCHPLPVRACYGAHGWPAAAHLGVLVRVRTAGLLRHTSACSCGCARLACCGTPRRARAGAHGWPAGLLRHTSACSCGCARLACCGTPRRARARRRPHRRRCRG
jgi:hypothetical protein